MFSFSTTQKALDLNGTKVGGQPGEHPTLLLGTAFYGKKYEELDAGKLAKVEGWLSKQRELSDLTGVGAMADLYLGSEDHVRPRIEFFVEHFPGEVFSIDVPEAEVRMAALTYLKQHGLNGKAVLNSLNLGVEARELELLRDCAPLAIITLGYNPRDMSTDGRAEILESGAGLLEKGLVGMALETGVENILLDTGATPFDHSAEETLRAIPVFKNKWGYPVGCSLHNTAESWLWMKQFKKDNREAYKALDASTNALTVLSGGDFSVYGPVRNAPLVFPLVAFADKLVAEGSEEYFGVDVAPGHPRRKLG